MNHPQTAHGLPVPGTTPGLIFTAHKQVHFSTSLLRLSPVPVMLGNAVVPTNLLYAVDNPSPCSSSITQNHQKPQALLICRIPFLEDEPAVYNTAVQLDAA